MTKKNIKLIQLSKIVHIIIEEMRNLGVENFDQIFLEIYTE